MRKLKFFLRNNDDDHTVPLSHGMVLEPSHWDMVFEDEGSASDYRVRVHISGEDLVVEGLDDTNAARVGGHTVAKGERKQLKAGETIQFGDQSFVVMAEHQADFVSRTERPPSAAGKVFRTFVATMLLMTFVASLIAYAVIPSVKLWLARGKPDTSCLSKVDKANQLSCFRLAHGMDKIDGKELSAEDRAKIFANLEAWESSNRLTAEETFERLPNERKRLILSAYEEALAASRRQQHQLVEKACQKILAVIPEFRDTRRMLANAQRRINSAHFQVERPRMPASNRFKSIDMTRGN